MPACSYIGIPFFVIILVGYKIGLKSKLVDPKEVDLSQLLAVIEQYEKRTQGTELPESSSRQDDEKVSGEAQGEGIQGLGGEDVVAKKPWWQRVWANI